MAGDETLSRTDLRTLGLDALILSLLYVALFVRFVTLDNGSQSWQQEFPLHVLHNVCILSSDRLHFVSFYALPDFMCLQSCASTQDTPLPAVFLIAILLLLDHNCSNVTRTITVLRITCTYTVSQSRKTFSHRNWYSIGTGISSTLATGLYNFKRFAQIKNHSSRLDY